MSRRSDMNAFRVGFLQHTLKTELGEKEAEEIIKSMEESAEKYYPPEEYEND